jgi:hypothetical protein
MTPSSTGLLAVVLLISGCSCGEPPCPAGVCEPADDRNVPSLPVGPADGEGEGEAGEGG